MRIRAGGPAAAVVVCVRKKIERSPHMKITALTLSTALLALGAAPAGATWGQRYREQRPEWMNLGVVHADGRHDTLVVDRRAGRIDDLKIEATRGMVDIATVVVTARDGRQYVLPVNQRLYAGRSQFLRVPGPAQRIASVELTYPTRRAGWWGRMFTRNRGELAVLAR
jgi:hypothetical protein